MFPGKDYINFADVAAEYVGQRQNAGLILDWIRNNPESFANRLDWINSGIAFVNDGFRRRMPGLYRNINEVKKRQPGIEILPFFINSMFRIPEWEFEGSLAITRQVLGEMNERMSKGEVDRVEPWLAFHTKKTTAEALAVGFAIHYWEVCMEPTRRFKGVFKDGQLVDCLVEGLARISKDNPVFYAVAARSQLNWIEGWEGFDPRFRKRLGYV